MLDDEERSLQSGESEALSDGASNDVQTSDQLRRVAKLQAPLQFKAWLVSWIALPVSTYRSTLFSSS